MAFHVGRVAVLTERAGKGIGRDIQNRGDNAAVGDAGVALVTVGDAVFAADFVFAVVVEVELQANRVLQAADKAVMGVGLAVLQGRFSRVGFKEVDYTASVQTDRRFPSRMAEMGRDG